jgi:hypothetical protein
MRPPLKKRIDSNLLPTPADSKSEGLEEKAKLARHLHDQSVNPLRWTEAHPARQAEQQVYQETGLKRRDNQFEVDGKLYDWTPSVTATPEQAKAIANAYIAERSGKDDAAALTPKIEDLVDIAEVPPKHPFGTPHNERPANDMSAAEERIALLRHYAQSGVDPDKAHLGDPVYMKDQERLKAQIEKTLPGDRSEISGLPGFYLGFDDGWIYRTNEHTRESQAIQKIRREYADGASDAANDDSPALIEQMARHYSGKMHAAMPGHEATSNGTRDSDSETAAKSASADNTAEDPGAIYDGRAKERLRVAVEWMPTVVSAIEHAQAGQKGTDEEVLLLSRITQAFEKVGIQFDPKKTNIKYLRQVAKAIESAATKTGSNGNGAPLYLLAQAQNVELAQALVGSTMQWASVSQKGMTEAVTRGLQSQRKYANMAATAMPLLAGLAAGKGAAEILRKMAEEDESPNLISPYPESGGLFEQSANPMEQAAASNEKSNKLGTLTAADLASVEKIFTEKPSTFNRSTPVSMPSSQKAEILSSGQVDEIELFGLPIYLSDPRGNVQTQERIDKLKQMVRDKLIECGMEEDEAWGGKIANDATERAKERLVPKGNKGLAGSRRADLSFKIRWFGNTYVVDINTVDVLKNGSMTKAERIAAEGLRLNRLIRLSINEELPEGAKALEEYAGKIGTVPKGKDMSDEEWEVAAREWVDSFLDCDGPLEADVHLDPESKHPWPQKGQK